MITDKTIPHNKPDITVIDKQHNNAFVIDISIPNNHNMDRKHREKVEKYTELKREIKDMWRLNEVKIVPIILTSMGLIPINLKNSLEDIGIQYKTYREIPLELLKYGTDKLYKQLDSFFQKCLNGENIPKEWKTSYIITIHKKGSKDDCDNYRGISVLSSVSRFYGKLVKKRIEEEYRDMEAEEQAGFRAGRSTVDHLFTLTQIIEKKMARNQEIHLLYVDLKKA
ncbi:uncharacterized protein LOC115886156 [Sitophilus oryzae]|uniref:Uncharacterized protein LOC115886156 n=1 Tax=Sitophilus oryzae TaxID=7048 RepID=A0A6J2YD24_SITOR|nr:uncharacterized protein LOC115886156 [Sitophilus oryzae]